MEKNMLEISFDKGIFSTFAIQRVLEGYTKEFYITMKDEDDKIFVSMEEKDKNSDLSVMKKEIMNQVLEEEVRIKLEEETKKIRESIFQNAMKMK